MPSSAGRLTWSRDAEVALVGVDEGRRQPCRVLLLGLTGTSLLLLFANQANLGTPYCSHPSGLPPPYPYRSIQDYQSPEHNTGNTSGPAGGSRQHDETWNEAVHGAASPSGAGSEVPHGHTKHEERNKDSSIIPEKKKDQKLSDYGVEKVREESLKPAPDEALGRLGDGGQGINIVEGDRETEEGKIKPEERDTRLDDVDTWLEQEMEARRIREEIKLQLVDGTVKEKVEAILRRERRILKQAMEGYMFHPKLKAKALSDLVLEEGGQPVRNLVVTTWRSGSTFIGDVLFSHPATFYHYEPLLDFEINQVRYGVNATQAIFNIRHLLKCNYTDMEHYLNYGPDHPWLFNHNTHLWRYCASFPDICFQPEFLSSFCSIFPFQSLKTVRLRLNLTTELLNDKSLDVRVLLLVRDPRGTMQSRHHRVWCPGHPDCDDPARLCQDLVHDYNTARVLRKQFPHSIRVIRYEDLSFDAYNITKDLYNFFRLSYHSSVQMFLDTHTKKTIGGVSSTFRDSRAAPIHWQQDLSWQEVESIQRVCSSAIRLWGYEIAKDETHLRTFMPVGNFKYF